MTDGAWEIVGRFDHQISEEKNVGEALRALIARRLKHRAREHVEEVWGCDPKTARNFTSNSNLSIRTLTKAAQAEGWDLWHALGVELFGETYAEHLRGVINEYEERRERTRAHRDHVQGLEEKALRLVSLLDRPQA